MRYTKYSKWTGQSWDDISLEELMDTLSDYLLQSGFHDQFRRQSRRRSRGWDDDFENFDPEDALEGLRRGKLFVIPGWHYRLLVSFVTKLPAPFRVALESRAGLPARLENPQCR